MQKITFEDLPSTNTPINASNLNAIQSNVEGAMKNAETTSTTDTYCCTYINGLPKTLETKGNYGSGTNLNNATTPGVYWCTGTPTNSPFSNGWLMVMAGGNFIKQIFFRAGTPGSNDYMTCVRTLYVGGEWSGWRVFAMA